MSSAVNAGMNGVIAVAKGSIQRLSNTDEPYSAAVRAMIQPADNLLSRKVPSLPFAQAPLGAVINELEESTGVKIVFPFGKHDKFTIDREVVVNIKSWGDITLGKALDRIGAEIKCPAIKWVTCDGVADAIFASEPVNMVPVSAGRTGMVGLIDIYKDEILGNAELKSQANQNGQSLLQIAATAEVFQPEGARLAPLIQKGADFDRVMYVSGPKQGRLLWRLVNAEKARAPETMDQQTRRQVIKDLKTIVGFNKAIAAAEAMKSELEKPVVDLKKLAEKKKLDFSETKMFARKMLDTRTGQIVTSNLPDIGQDDDFIKQAFMLVPSDPDNPGILQPTMVIPLRRQKKVLLVRRTGYEPVTKADFAGLIVGRTIAQVPRQDESGQITMGYSIVDIKLDDVLARQRLYQTAITWFSEESVVKRGKLQAQRTIIAKNVNPE